MATITPTRLNILGRNWKVPSLASSLNQVLQVSRICSGYVCVVSFDLADVESLNLAATSCFDAANLLIETPWHGSSALPSSLLMADPAGAEQSRPRQYATVNANDNASLVLGDVYNYGVLFGAPADEPSVKKFGLCLASAPTIPPNNFIGRAAELEQMTAYFQPGEGAVSEQKRLALGGIGGVGKTQLSLAFVRLHQQIYKSAFWLNATTEISLIASFRSMASLLVKAQEFSKLDDEQIVLQCHKWLTDVRNKDWLLVFDNYDDPELFDISKYYPLAGYGSILVTTRRPDLMNDEVLRLQSLVDVDECLQILEIRSRRRDVKQDQYARLLAERLGGFPLALVTAGAHLSKSTLTFEQYLQQYDQHWNLDPRRPLRLAEYRDRTLHTTWNLSYSRLEADDPDAAKWLQLLAHFDNQDIWYELLHAGLKDDLPGCLRETLSDRLTFDSVMRTLSEYCFVEAHALTQSYSLHNCVHDWTLGELNKDIQPSLYWYAFDCVAANIPDHMNALGPLGDKRPVRHVVRLISPRFDSDILFNDISSDRMKSAFLMGALLTEQRQFAPSERFLLRVQAISLRAHARKEVMGAESDVLSVSLRLAMLYYRQGHLAETENVLLQARSIWKQGSQISNEFIASIHHRLGMLYSDQHRSAEAEQMFLQAVTMFEALGESNQHFIINTLICLGVLYQRQNKYNKAETTCKQVLSSSEKLLGSEHDSTLIAANNLAMIWLAQNRFDEVEKEMKRILMVRQKNYDRLHGGTLLAMHNVAIVYRKQARLDLARALHEELLLLLEEKFGPDHVETLETVDALGTTCYYQFDLDNAEKLWRRALTGFQRILPPNHTVLVTITRNLEVILETRREMHGADARKY